MKLWKNYGTKLACFYLVIIILAGCGTRKTAKEYHTFKSDTLNTNNNYELKQNKAFNDILSVKPIDSTKPIIINGISYYNASILFDKSKFDNLEIKANNNLSQSSSSEDLNKKNTVSKNENLLWLGIVFVAALFIFLWFYLPKLKIN